MENHSPERKFENKMNSEISLEDLRNQKANMKLALRKEKRNRDIILGLKEKINFLCESHYNIHINLLKTNNDEIRNFYLDLNNPEDSMKKLKFLLSSKDDNEIKFGLLAIRKFFQELVRELYDKEGQSNSHKISKNEIKMCDDFDIFIKNKIIDLLFEILNKNIDKDNKNCYINIYEILWIFINMTSVYPKEENKRFEFFNILLNQNNLNILINLIKINVPQEIIINVLTLFSNIALEEDAVIEVLVNSSLTQVIFNYLKANKNINKEILTKIYKVLYLLYSTFKKLDIQANKILFKIFSLPLYNFKNKEILIYCLEMLNLLSKNNDPQIENCFNDINIFSAFNTIIFDFNIEGNENLIDSILDIFTNLIEKKNPELEKNIINSGSCLKFYNNLLNKYKKENKIIDRKAEENIIIAINNVILFDNSDNIKYIFGEGREILNFFIDSGKSIFQSMRNLGIKSFLNILMKKNIDIDINIIFDMVNIVNDTLMLEEFSNCYGECLKVSYVIMEKSRKMNFKNDLKTYLNNKGFINYIEKIETKFLNNANSLKFDNDDVDNYLNIIDEIKYFLNN